MEIIKKIVFNKIVIWIFITMLLWLNIYIWWLIVIPYIIILLIISILLSYWWHLLYSKIFKKETKNLKDYSIYLLKRVYIYLVFFYTFLSFFIIYHNEINPAYLNMYTLSNGTQTIHFQSMQHIWSQNFYDNVIENIKEVKSNSWVLYFEWVRPWKETNHDKFNGLLWVKLDATTYSSISKIYWLVEQNNKDFLNIINDKDYNVDISIDDIVNIFEKKYWKVKTISNTSSWKVEEDWVVNVEKITNESTKKLIEKFDELDDNQRKVLIYMNKWLMSFSIKNEWIREVIIKLLWKDNLIDVIKNWRNEHLVKYILENNKKDKNVIILYWDMHFNWVYELLKKHWYKIINTQKYFTID